MHPILAYGAVALYSLSLATLLICEIFCLFTCFSVLLSIKDERKEKSLDDTRQQRNWSIWASGKCKKRLETKPVNFSPYWMPSSWDQRMEAITEPRNFPNPKALCQVFFFPFFPELTLFSPEVSHPIDTSPLLLNSPRWINQASAYSRFR